MRSTNARPLAGPHPTAGAHPLDEAIAPAVPQWSYGALGIAMALLGAVAVRLLAAVVRHRRSRSRQLSDPGREA